MPLPSQVSRQARKGGTLTISDKDRHTGVDDLNSNDAILIDNGKPSSRAESTSPLAAAPAARRRTNTHEKEKLASLDKPMHGGSLDNKLAPIPEEGPARIEKSQRTKGAKKSDKS
eukprot:CAMPEP_0174750738 /NCGR_PEP_ID=MMETSP1094-20130205/98377_1 /TAXON_ID=156173 /ORGANISM="Chrysochromulina brevifilum, Strain UTEX LB 985" /LENGTH=114 /DNA_ID=CAMNT_0015956129 /DNA_START=9 /DNA_END=353 /DNA_ORIENTATION=-